MINWLYAVTNVLKLSYMCTLLIGFVAPTVAVASALSEQASSETIPLNLAQVIVLENNRAPSSKPFRATITLPADEAIEGIEMVFVAGPNRADSEASIIGQRYANGNRVVYELQGTVPEYGEIFRGVRRRWYEGWWAARQAELNIVLHLRDTTPIQHKSLFAVPLRTTGTFWGVVVLVLFMVAGALTKPNPFAKDPRFAKDTRREDWKNKPPLERALLFPLQFTITPIGTYSISMFQVMFWTGVVIFASVYVFFVRGEFLNVTEQVLVLLGISGGTAIGAKVNAVLRSGDICGEYLSGITRNVLPRLRNLVCIHGQPNTFKFQIFAFTLINGLIVLRQLYADFDFPSIPDGQLALMGISGGVYLGNEVGMENIWKQIRDRIKTAKQAKTEAEKEKCLKEVTDKLKSIYENSPD